MADASTDALTLASPAAGADEARRLDDAVRRLAGRLAGLLAELEGSGEGPAIGFLRDLALDDLGGWDGSCLDLPPGGAAHPVDRLAAALALEPADLDLLLLAGAPNQHEGLAWVLRRLHPAGEPWPTAGLVGALATAGLVPGLGSRTDARNRLTRGPLARPGAVVVEGAGPFTERSVRCPSSLWGALNGDDAWPDAVRPILRPTPRWGLDGWLDEPPVAAARRAVAVLDAVAVVATSDRPDATAARLGALVEAAGRTAALLAAATLDDRALTSVALHAIAHGAVPVVAVEGRLDADLPVTDVPWPVVLSVPAGSRVTTWPRPQFEVPVGPLDLGSRLAATAGALPELGEPLRPVGPATIEPSDLAIAAVDLRSAAALTGGTFSRTDLTRVVDDRTTTSVPAGAVLVHPSADWDDLVLPPGRMAQLREAVHRVTGQGVVFDRWGFLEGRLGRRGLRLLFAGPPGTGKTLAAEVVAGALGRDLLVVDISRMVSKWIGETEKNLAAAFEAAERGGMALLFDEADALFGKRTEVGDARDRYANLETAYLLSRLERFDGLAMLASNLRQNLDSAFARRLEFIVPFDLPDTEQRVALWTRHIPPGAPLASGVRLERLAALYPLPGALIRNAAVAAAFLAAAEGSDIEPRHLVHAIEREYVKAGDAFPGPPPEDAQ